MLRGAPFTCTACHRVGTLRGRLPGLNQWFGYVDGTARSTGSFVGLPRPEDFSLLDTAPSSKYLPQLEALVSEAFQKPSQANRRPRTPRNIDEAGKIQCAVCGKRRADQDFYKKTGSVCKTCYRDSCRDYRRTLRGNAVVMVGAATLRAKKHGMNCSLTRRDILDMLLDQGGRCAYSEVPMELLIPQSHWRMSLERLDNSKGYSRENCVLICAEFNSSDYSRSPGVDRASVRGTAQWSPEKIRFVGEAFACEVDQQKLARDVEEALSKRLVSIPRNPAPFSSTYAYYHTLRGKAKVMANSAATRSRKWGRTCDIDCHHIFDMLLAQGGRCFYSGVPTGVWKVPRRLGHVT